MPTGGQIGSGVQIAYSLASPHAWVEVPELFDVSQLPNRIRDRIESTIHGVTGDRTYITGLSDVEDLVFTVRVNLDAGSIHSNLRTFQLNKTVLWWRVEVPVSSTLSTTLFIGYTFQGEIASAPVSAPKDDLKTMEVTVLHTSDLFIQDAMAAAF